MARAAAPCSKQDAEWTVGGFTHPRKAQSSLMNLSNAVTGWQTWETLLSDNRNSTIACWMSFPLFPSFFPFSSLYPSLPSLFPSSILFIYLSLKYLLSTYYAGRKCRPTSKSLEPWSQALCFHPQWLRHGLRFSFLISQKRTITDLPPRIVEGLYHLLHIKYFALPLAFPKCSPKFYHCY